MKKLMFGLAIAAVGTAFAVESSNIVGYKSDTLTTGNFNMIAIPFNNVDGSGVQPNGDLQFEGVVEGTSFDDCDLLEVWDPSRGYTFHFFFEGDGWTDDSGNGYFEDDYPDGLPAGATLWYEATTSANTLRVTYSGAVESESDVSYTLTTGNFNMIANPFPISWDPNDDTKVEWSGVVEGTSFDDCDLIEVWDPERGYTYHFFYEGDGWTDDSGNGYFADDYPDGLGAGHPFWYEAAASSNELTVKFIKPF